MDHILVIGGSGNIGFPLIKSLSQNPDNKIIAGVFHIEKATGLFKEFPKTHLFV